MNDSDFSDVGELLRRQLEGELGPLTTGEEILPGLIRFHEQVRGGSSFLVARTGEFLEYVRPTVDDDEALQAFETGRRTRTNPR